MEAYVPWAALYRKALVFGIGDNAFWRMSTAALETITAGMRRGRTQGGHGRVENAAPRAVGSLTDCP